MTAARVKRILTDVEGEFQKHNVEGGLKWELREIIGAQNLV